MPKNSALVLTVVISDMVRDICKDYGVFCEASGLIGFKNTAMKIREYEKEGTYNYVFGLEDSDGCLPGTYARDKDSVGTAMLLAEAAAVAHNKGLTLWDEMKRLYEKYGWILHISLSRVCVWTPCCSLERLKSSLFDVCYWKKQFKKMIILIIAYAVAAILVFHFFRESLIDGVLAWFRIEELTTGRMDIVSDMIEMLNNHPSRYRN